MKLLLKIKYLLIKTAIYQYINTIFLLNFEEVFVKILKSNLSVSSVNYSLAKQKSVAKKQII